MFILDFTSINKYVIVCLVTKNNKTSKRQKGTNEWQQKKQQKK